MSYASRAHVAKRLLKWQRLERLVKQLAPDLMDLVAERRARATAPVPEIATPMWITKQRAGANGDE